MWSAGFWVNISCHFKLLDLLVVGFDKIFCGEVVLLAEINKRHHCSRWGAHILAAKDCLSISVDSVF